MATAREAFNAAVFARDGCKCVMCGDPAEDAHHILDRKLFPDGGYVADNGASVCNPCHMRCESTEIGCHELRSRIGVDRAVLPPGFEPGRAYDKWGNELLSGGLRVAGPLADDDGCIRALASARLSHLLVRPDGLAIPDWVGYSLPDAGSRRDWRTAVAALHEAWGDGAIHAWLFHGTSAEKAALIASGGMQPTDTMCRDGDGQTFTEGSFWGTPLTAAWYAEDTFLEREGDAPAIVACPVDALEADGEFVPDEATIDFPDARTLGMSVEEAHAAWEALGDDADWMDGLGIWGAVVCLHEFALDAGAVVDVSSPGDAAALVEMASEESPSP
jgi:hypothetical protein